MRGGSAGVRIQSAVIDAPFSFPRPSAPLRDQHVAVARALSRRAGQRSTLERPRPMWDRLRECGIDSCTSWGLAAERDRAASSRAANCRLFAGLRRCRSGMAGARHRRVGILHHRGTSRRPDGRPGTDLERRATHCTRAACSLIVDFIPNHVGSTIPG